jgi:hypothetical protein
MANALPKRNAGVMRTHAFTPSPFIVISEPAVYLQLARTEHAEPSDSAVSTNTVPPTGIRAFREVRAANFVKGQDGVCDFSHKEGKGIGNRQDPSRYPFDIWRPKRLPDIVDSYTRD